MDYITQKPTKAADDLLFTVIGGNRISELLMLIDDGEVDLNCSDINGTTPLIAACYARCTNAVKVLIEHGADVDRHESVQIGERTALHTAVEKNEYDIAMLLLDAGASTTAIDSRKRTPLHYAARDGYLNLVELLINYGADVNVRDIDGNNPSYYAMQGNHDSLLQVLPKPLSITYAQYVEFREQYGRVHIITDKRKKKKGKKRK